MKRRYKSLSRIKFTRDSCSLVPIRDEDRWDIMKWRNEQMYHLRQSKTLTKEDQELYFTTVIPPLFDQPQPPQILFSFLENETCRGYGGLVHLDWDQKTGEVSFIMNTELEDQHFDFYWSTYLGLLDEVAFEELMLEKISTYAYDLRPHLYPILEKAGFCREAVLKGKHQIDGKSIDVVIHSKTRKVS